MAAKKKKARVSPDQGAGSNGGEDRRARLKAVNSVDKQWFFDRLAATGLSLRAAAARMDMDPSALSNIFNGVRRMRLEEAADIARELGVSFDEVVQRAGIQPPAETAAMVPVAGVVDARGAIGGLPVGLPRRMERPGRLPADATCVVIDAPGQALDRAVAYWAGTLIATSPEAVGRLSVIQLAGGARVMGVLRRTYREGKWSVTSLDGQMIVGDGIGRRRGPGPADTDLRVTVTKCPFRGVTAKCLKVLGLYGSYGCNGVFASRTAARCAALRVVRPAGGNYRCEA